MQPSLIPFTGAGKRNFRWVSLALKQQVRSEKGEETANDIGDGCNDENNRSCTAHSHTHPRLRGINRAGRVAR